MLSEIFKSYDVRGIYGKTLTKDVASNIGKAIVTFLMCKELIVGRDMRKSSPILAKALMQGATELGCGIIDIGEVSTDCLYFASGYLKTPAVMFTASHNPKEYNGIKFCKEGAMPLNYENGLNKVKEIVEKKRFRKVSQTIGEITEMNLVSEFTKHVISFSDVQLSFRRMKVAVDAGNGMAGKMIPLVYRDSPIKIVPLFFKLDGTFPNHPADPSKSENLKQLQETVKKQKCDFGMAFDGDADRIFFVDEKGHVCNSSLISALIIKKLLNRNESDSIRFHNANAASEKVIHNLVCGRIVHETILKYNAKPLRERVGHSYIKDTMRKNNAIFGCEHSAHYYYRDNFNADSGIITSIIVISIISKSGKRLSQLLQEFKKYNTIEEISVQVKNKEAKMKQIKNIYAKGAKMFDELDGVSIDKGDFWFNVRPSNTEPLLRLNLEAVSEKLMKEKKVELLKLMNQKDNLLPLNL